MSARRLVSTARFMGKLCSRSTSCSFITKRFGLAGLFGLMLSVWVCTAGAEQTPTFEGDLEVDVQSGYATLSWDFDGQPSQGSPEYQLVRSESPRFDTQEVFYEGPDRQVFVSGLPSGTYFFKVRAKTEEGFGAWSEVKRVNVVHHSFALSIFLFGVGAAVFALTLWFIMRGTSRTRVASRI